MSWGAVAGAAVGVIGSSMSDSKGGGGGGQSQTQSKDPWAPAAPWLMSNLVQGQNLQNQYTAQPFNAQQLAAYGAMGRQSNYMNALTPDLLNQIQTQKLGFDRSNPSAKPNPYQFGGTGANGRGNLLDLLTTDPAPVSAANPPPAPPPKKPDFMQQGMTAFTMPSWNAGDPMTIMNDANAQYEQLHSTPGAQVGSYGAFSYGMDMPKAGTQAYRDMNEYFAYGGRDPMGKYGRGAPAGAPMGYFAGSSDTGIGSGANGDGAGPDGAGATW